MNHRPRGCAQARAGSDSPQAAATALVADWVQPAGGRTALPPVKAVRNPDAIAITPDVKTAYVANLEPGTATPIRTATNTALPPIKTGGSPEAIAITP